MAIPVHDDQHPRSTVSVPGVQQPSQPHRSPKRTGNASTERQLDSALSDEVNVKASSIVGPWLLQLIANNQGVGTALDSARSRPHQQSSTMFP